MTKKRRGKRKVERRRKRKTRLKALAQGVFVAAIWGFIALMGITAWYAYHLPDVSKALDATRRPAITILAADGSEIATMGDLYGMPVSLETLPPALPRAVLATEDRRFYRHFGLDVIGLARAALANIMAGRIVQGGSTITQQVAKNLFLTPERTIKRKAQEVLLALWLERKFSKDQILTVYLNRVYLGNGVYGMAAAARKYFGIPARQLSTHQAAMLAGLLKAPSRYNPRSNPKLAAKRASQVLANMVAAGYLAPAEAKRAKAQKTRSVAVSGGRGFARYFADWVVEQVSGYVTPGNRDIVVLTTLNAALQRLAEAKAKAMLDKTAKKFKVSETALVAMSPDGAVSAMVGGRDYMKSQFNRATQALRQPGSAFKPFVYLAGLEAGLSPESRFVDAPLTIGTWSPRNFSRRFEGEVSMGEALARSINTVAVRVSEGAGRGNVIKVARRLGLTSNLKADPSLALGSGEVGLIELTAAYAAFANGGYGVWPYAIKEIREASGRELYRRSGSGPGRVMDARHAAAMNSMLSEAMKSGTGRAAGLPRPVAGKTGTSQNFRDAWFVGYSAELVTGVWMGNDNGKPMAKVTGGGLPAKLWRDFMAAALQGAPPRSLPGVGPGAGLRAGQKLDPKEKGFWDKLLAAVSN